jgi:hypothetical protein
MANVGMKFLEKFCLVFEWYGLKTGLETGFFYAGFFNKTWVY